ncbi:hypothetical protein C0995_014376 [Termitomyces sp. Mi166|nr:hypothetical protein C0995_014376 [Termitomyces sp. Mi166\
MASDSALLYRVQGHLLLSPFGMGNTNNLGGTPFFGPPPEPPGSSLPNWLPGSLPLGGGAPEEVPLSGSPDGGPSSKWGLAIMAAEITTIITTMLVPPPRTIMIESKPHTLASDQAQIAFAMSYLQGIALDHYTTILCFNPGHPLFTNWQAFVNKFSSNFRVFDMVFKAERKLVSFRMSANKRFTMFIVQFEKEAYETGWNYALRFQLSEALSKHIHDML